MVSRSKKPDCEWRQFGLIIPFTKSPSPSFGQKFEAFHREKLDAETSADSGPVTASSTLFSSTPASLLPCYSVPVSSQAPKPIPPASESYDNPSSVSFDMDRDSSTEYIPTLPAQKSTLDQEMPTLPSAPTIPSSVASSLPSHPPRPQSLTPSPPTQPSTPSVDFISLYNPDPELPLCTPEEEEYTTNESLESPLTLPRATSPPIIRCLMHPSVERIESTICPKGKRCLHFLAGGECSFKLHFAVCCPRAHSKINRSRCKSEDTCKLIHLPEKLAKQQPRLRCCKWIEFSDCTVKERCCTAYHGSLEEWKASWVAFDHEVDLYQVGRI